MFFVSPLSKKGAPIVFIISVLSICAILLLSSHVSAYTLEGPTWANQKPPHTCCGNFAIQFFNGTWFGNDKQGFINGYSAWNSDGNAYVYFYSANSSPLFVDDYASGSGDTRDGHTDYLYDSNHHFTSVKSYLNYHYTQNYDSGKIQGVAAHELGHAVGLGHAGGCVLMVDNTPARSSCGVTGPRSDDENGVNSLY